MTAPSTAPLRTTPAKPGPFRRLIDAQNSEELLDIAAAMLGSDVPFTAAHASTAFNLLGKLSVREGRGEAPWSGDARYATLLEGVAAALPLCDSRSLPGFAIALHGMRAPPPAPWLAARAAGGANLLADGPARLPSAAAFPDAHVAPHDAEYESAGPERAGRGDARCNLLFAA